MTGLRGVLTFESMCLSYLPQEWLLEPSKLLEHAFNVWCMPEFLQCTAHIRLVSWPKQSHYESHRIADVTRPRVLTSQGPLILSSHVRRCNHQVITGPQSPDI